MLRSWFDRKSSTAPNSSSKPGETDHLSSSTSSATVTTHVPGFPGINVELHPHDKTSHVGTVSSSPSSGLASQLSAASEPKGSFQRMATDTGVIYDMDDSWAKLPLDPSKPTIKKLPTTPSAAEKSSLPVSPSAAEKPSLSVSPSAASSVASKSPAGESSVPTKPDWAQRYRIFFPPIFDDDLPAKKPLTVSTSPSSAPVSSSAKVSKTPEGMASDTNKEKPEWAQKYRIFFPPTY
jgi:hypothetical protein